MFVSIFDFKGQINPYLTFSQALKFVSHFLESWFKVGNKKNPKLFIYKFMSLGKAQVEIYVQ